MNKKYTKDELYKLCIDDKSIIIEALIPDQYYNGQTEIKIWVPENFDFEAGQPLPETPPDIKKNEDRKYESLINSLINQLFLGKDMIMIEFDLEAYKIELEKSNNKFIDELSD